ncbi:MAG: nucleoid-associated protein [Allomuricauda sp.]
MNISRIVIHYLEKKQNETKAEIDFSDILLEKNDFADFLVNEVHSAINDDSSLKNACFKQDEENKFTLNFKSYLESSSDDTFMEFSKSLELLKEKVEKEPFAKGGYYLFVDYTFQGTRFISVVLLRKKSGLNILKKGQNFILDSIENLNIEKIAIGLRINCSIYLSPGDTRNYMALITKQRDGEVSEYFKEWVLVEGLIKNSVNTESLVSILKTIPLPTDEDGNERYTRSDFKKAVYEHVNHRKDKRVNLFEISEIFYGTDQKTAIRDFADSNEIVVDTEFKRESSKWKSLVSIKASVKGIDISIDYDRFNQSNDGVQVSNDTIIIKSKELADKIQKQYDKY